MDIVYIAYVAPRKWFTALVEKKQAFSIPAYKFNDLIIKGLRKNGVRVHVPVEPSLWSAVLDKAQDGVYEEDGVLYYLLPEYTGMWQKTKNLRQWIAKILRESEEPHILCDAVYMLPTYIAERCARKTNTPVTGIFTDLPEFLRNRKRSLKDRLIEAMQRRTFKRYDGYVLLTEAMKNKIQRRGKPYMVMEGLVDADYALSAQPEKEKKCICIYAGVIHKIYGISTLVEGFLKAKPEGAELHIYGDGDYADALREICAKEPSVKWLGVVPNEKVVEAEQKATLLINPRPTDAEFTKYSFPSKNMEYMLSGTAVLTTNLPGMPKEYHPHVFLAENETVDGWAKTLCAVLSVDRDALEERGRQAQRFVREEKSNIAQARRMLSFLESL